MKKFFVLVIVLLLVPLTTLAQDACEGNFDCDQDVDGTDAAVFKSDFGRSAFKNPCPACTPACEYPAPVPKTGQTDCWAENGAPILCQTCQIGGGGCTNKTGQDGMWEKGVELPEPRFTDNGDGTVTDNLTGLIWLKNAHCFGDRLWQEALDGCNGLSAGYCGLTDGSSEGDWRLPNRRELFSLIHDGYSGPAISNTAGTGKWTPGDPFTIFDPHCSYWSSTTESNGPGYAWTVEIYSGGMDPYIKDALHLCVWPVRGGQ